MKKDKCVLCGKETEYDETTHIDLRIGYVEGDGQTCSNGCPKELDYIKVSRNIIYDFPNNYDLGKYIRNLFN